jgi:hypothetical protein
MTSIDFVHLHQTGLNSCTLDKRTHDAAVRAWLCTGCNAPRPSVGAINIQIQEDRPPNVPITFIYGYGVILAHTNLIERLDFESVRRDLLLGEVRDSSGSLLNGWVTVRGRRRLIIRGTKHVSHRVCDSCGRHVYFAMGMRYLFPSPASDASIFESNLFGLVVSASILEKTSLRRKSGFGMEVLRALPQSRDSLGELT